jgi:hypothetical protein
MKDIVITIILLGFAMVGLGQGASSPDRSRISFRWIERGARGLDHSQTIQASRELGTAEKESLIEALAAQLRPYKVDLQIGSEKELRRIVLTTRVKLVDLNNDGDAEVLAQAFGIKAGCGASGNCPFWVFQKMPNGFKKILDSRNKEGIGGIEVITISPDHTQGFRDLVFGTHDSAAERTLFIYRYHQGLYRRSECYKANWISFDDDQQKPDYPEITKCRE